MRNSSNIPDQLALPLPVEEREEQALRVAHRSARLRLPFELAIRDRALAICLRCLSEARRNSRRVASPPRGDARTMELALN
jgi:hypothetical protein